MQSMITLEQIPARGQPPACMLLHSLLPSCYDSYYPTSESSLDPLCATSAHALLTLLKPCLGVLLQRLLLHSFLPVPPLALGYAHPLNGLLAMLLPKPGL